MLYSPIEKEKALAMSTLVKINLVIAGVALVIAAVGWIFFIREMRRYR